MSKKQNSEKDATDRLVVQIKKAVKECGCCGCNGCCDTNNIPKETGERKKKN